MIKKPLLFLITVYQNTFSAVFGRSCRFYPSCSEYAKLTITKDGALRGVVKSAWRVLRCNPFNKGGIDYP